MKPELLEDLSPAKYNPRQISEDEFGKLKMSDKQLYSLLCQYARWHHLRFKHVYRLDTSEEDIFGILAVKALESKPKFNGKSSLRTFYIQAFNRCMQDYRKYLFIRQVKYPMERAV